VETAAASEPAWGVVRPAAFDSRQWGDDIVLYVVATGETHALVPAQSATLALLLEHPGTAVSAPRWLNLMSADSSLPAASVQEDQADLIALQEALNYLHHIGVVERVPA
jgi:hypothetical protein